MGLIPSDGFSLTVVLRGVVGMLVLLFIAYLLSNNRKAIAWKTVGVGTTVADNYRYRSYKSALGHTNL